MFGILIFSGIENIRRMTKKEERIVINQVFLLFPYHQKL